MSELSQSLQVEEVDAVASEESMQTAATIRMPSLRDEKLPKGTHDPTFTRPSSSARANVLGPKVERFLPPLISLNPINLSLLLLIKLPDELEEK